MPTYILDENLKRELNHNGRNYWDVYIQEINELLGVRAKRLSLADVENREELQTVKTLLIGQQSGAKPTERALRMLEQWVKDGGILIGFALEGLDEVFGIKQVSRIQQAPDDYTISGYFDLRPHPLTHEIHPFLLHEQKLLILSDIRLAEQKGSAQLAHLYDPAGRDLQYPAITWNSYGKGFSGYFAFDVAKTVWVLRQGRPLPMAPEKRETSRTADLQVLGQNSRKVPYADEMCFILQNMMA